MKIGILGGGQLAYMLTEAAQTLGHFTLLLEPQDNCSASKVSDIIKAGYDDLTAIQTLIEQTDIITYENENIPLNTAHFIEEHGQLFPGSGILEHSQDRLNEKQLFRSLTINTTNFFNIETDSDLTEAAEKIHYPAIMKTRRFGYDGKGQTTIQHPDNLEKAWQKLDKKPCIVEEFVSFDRELSIIAVRSQQGECVFYPLTQNYHEQGILRLSIAPFIHPALQKTAEMYAKLILDKFNYVGTLAIEFFQVGNQLLANEMAPRVHNSGHWTIEGCKTSQFNNHIRAITGMPLENPEIKGYSAMFNCIGSLPEKEKVLQYANTYYHDYYKEARPGRKLGHVTLQTDSKENFESLTEKLKALILSGFLPPQE